MRYLIATAFGFDEVLDNYYEPVDEERGRSLLTGMDKVQINCMKTDTCADNIHMGSMEALKRQFTP